MLITRKSLVVHEFSARLFCGCVLWVSVPSGMVGCGSVWLLHVSLCVYCISRLRFSDIGSMAEVDEKKGCASSSVGDWVKVEVKLLKCWSRLLVIRAWAVAVLFSSTCTVLKIFIEIGYRKNLSLYTLYILPLQYISLKTKKRSRTCPWNLLRQTCPLFQIFFFNFLL